MLHFDQITATLALNNLPVTYKRNDNAESKKVITITMDETTNNLQIISFRLWL